MESLFLRRKDGTALCSFLVAGGLADKLLGHLTTGGVGDHAPSRSAQVKPPAQLSTADLLNTGCIRQLPEGPGSPLLRFVYDIGELCHAKGACFEENSQEPKSYLLSYVKIGGSDCEKERPGRRFCFSSTWNRRYSLRRFARRFFSRLWMKPEIQSQAREW